MATKKQPTKLKDITQHNKPIQDEATLLISQAIDKNVPVETMERLLAMRRELKAEKAKEEYDLAMAEFQAECPVIQKTKKVFEKDRKTVRYQYAPLESVIEQVKELLAKHGFSYSINTIQDEKMLGVICKATHKSGHSEQTTFSVPIGTEGYMSDVQKYGARLTFAKRYAFCNAFGILTGDEDTDAVEPNQTQITIKEMGEQVEKEESKSRYSKLASEKQVSYLRKLLAEKHYTEKSLLKKYNAISLARLTIDEASEAIDKLTNLPIAVKTEETSDLVNEVAEGLEAQGI